MAKQIYLDNAAATPIDRTVLKKMTPFLKGSFGNASSLYNLGREAKKALEAARVRVAKVLGARPQEIIFTGSGSESNNLAIFGIARAYKKFGKHLITTKIEHHSVLKPFGELQKQGFKVTYLDVNKNGIVDLEKFKNVFRMSPGKQNHWALGCLFYL